VKLSDPDESPLAAREVQPRCARRSAGSLRSVAREPAVMARPGSSWHQRVV
jgi:hypothetical protein